MDAADSCRSEACYLSGRKHGRSWAVKRREFITLLGGAAAWPLSALAQQAQRVPRIGVLLPGTRSSFAVRVEALRQGLQQLGYVEGRTIGLEWRFADEKFDRLPDLA